ncbi:MAG: sulfatase-like hydrolase/transferase [Candidatus Lokiarchaeota archaeon]|nr:sulfatase-like hydrolase/transferase [Candidatus Lokiarchaeota archaeon]
MAIDKPNVLVIHADQHRFDCLSTAGNEDVDTPHIAALAQDGVVHTSCFTTFPLCTPARYSLLTGMYARQHLGVANETALPGGIATFPRVLKQAGYRTACVGKMHFQPTYLDVGFDTMLLAEQAGPGRYDDDYHRYLMERGLLDRTDMVDQVFEFRGKAPASYHEDFGSEPSSLDEKDYSTSWIRDRALEVMEGWGDGGGAGAGGNLLMVGFIKPHHPFDAPAPWRDMYDPERLSLLPGWTDANLPRDTRLYNGYFNNQALGPAALKRVMAQYYASISQIDACVGQMASLLKQKGLYDDTLVVYTSDHGEYMGFHHMLLKGNYMYDPLVRVPLVVKYPGNARAGERHDGLVSIIDITATIVDAAGCVLPRHLWAQEQPLEDADRELVFAEDHHGNYMVRSRRHKLLWYKGAESQFFDLEADPDELENRIADPACQAEVQRMKEALLAWLAFEARPAPHEDALAREIRAPNVAAGPDRAASRKLVREWLHGQMDARRGG